ncbi:ABC transporter substrate-binding protein [Rhizobium lusitanum]|uniref:substrate-binding periplasmic protein n=1 Tax=Rhizobium lusitanum TaxID=293958 RepID=UPI00195ED54B|nr:transporter substrate-binding domain-containing protein [Rhizobium lusitanum]MBM7048386.1 amino acid ABC transporter substrate-binding protein [Rhizobium lusitanum]
MQTVEKGKLTVAAYDYPPFTITSADGTFSGIDPKILMRVASENCLEVVTLVTDPAATIQAVVSGKADVAIGSWNRTAKRAAVLNMSAPIYLDFMGLYSKDGVDTIDALVGKNVGTVTGYFWVPDLQKLLGAHLKLYPTAVAMAQDLQVGRIDVAVNGYNAGTYIQRNSGGCKGIVTNKAQSDDRIQASVLPPANRLIPKETTVSVWQSIAASSFNARTEPSSKLWRRPALTRPWRMSASHGS